jgi:hypothetical protein
LIRFTARAGLNEVLDQLMINFEGLELELTIFQVEISDEGPNRWDDCQYDDDTQNSRIRIQPLHKIAESFYHFSILS